VFSPNSADIENDDAPVLIFVHGGNWHSGRKSLYNRVGRNFAKKGVVTVIPDYQKSPAVGYDSMTIQVTEAIEWVQQHVEQYGGDPTKIFLAGHSAGGHLVTLATVAPRYGIEPASIAGIVLIDAAGLDMAHYLKKNPPTEKNHYLTTWTSDPEEWKKASPIYFLDEKTPPFLVYVGNKTYPSIRTSNQRFLKELRKYRPETKTIYLDKRHIQMMTQFFYSGSARYKEVLRFMETAVE
jgi:acetyl esterase/lipase